MLTLGDTRYNYASREKLKLGLLQTFRKEMNICVEASRLSCHMCSNKGGNRETAATDGDAGATAPCFCNNTILDTT